MFPPKIIGIIGNRGRMARNIIEPFFIDAGYPVIGSDIVNPAGLSNAEVVARADVVFFTILPLDNVAPAMREQIPNARPNTLWLHGSSAQQVRDNPIGDVLLSPELREHGTDAGFLHYMIAPTVRSLRGQSVVAGFPQDLINPGWKDWLESLLRAKKARLTYKTINGHDLLTVPSQVDPMLKAVATGMVWRLFGVDVSEMLRVAGAPARLQALGVIRTLGQPEVVSEIITRHPAGPTLVRTYAEVFTKLADMVDRKDAESIAAEMKQARERIDEEDLRKILSTTDWLVRILGDLNGGAVGLTFSKEQNQVGLGARVLSHFDRYGIDKTTTSMQTLSDGSASFFIGVKPDLDDPSVRAAEREIIDELGAEPIEGGFTI